MVYQCAGETSEARYASSALIWHARCEL
jgi:hypothetical protein